ncbi:acetamidase/formamidase family protein [Pseudorhodoplanes sp.]|uniref:acetamidase/formamidase family protein n=1 Tax=Pseudorhodoplanes sp. TaxID=1934341 RepID=UPI002C145E8F|nr:acetamidase/formamidase family protein [Pseudorhodoplanes sp.]HWV55038.1 acetamidase/formamidase family protein [Pseudorhodoplanes sp.]
MAHHRLEASPDTVHWGHFDARLSPALTIDSGDTVTITTVSGLAGMLPAADSGFTIAPALSAIHGKLEPKLGPHICTGPVVIRDAKAGDILEVRIKAVELLDDWGFNLILPGAGGLPDDFTEQRLIFIGLDKQKKVGRLPWGADIPLRPFFGVMGVAPSPTLGTVSSVPPGSHGGNIDNKELVPGAILYLPIHVDGALFSVGDGHGAQGDGEVCLTAIETGLSGTFELHLHKSKAGSKPLEWPYAETPTHLITMAFDSDLDVCASTALRDMIAAICARTGLSREDAYTLCSLAADLRVTQIVNGNKGVHVMLDKTYLKRT